MIMLRQRIGKFLSYLEQQIYPLTREVTDIRFIKSEENYRGRMDLNAGSPLAAGGYGEATESITGSTLRQRYRNALRENVSALRSSPERKGDGTQPTRSSPVMWTVCCARDWMSITGRWSFPNMLRRGRSTGSFSLRSQGTRILT